MRRLPLAGLILAAVAVYAVVRATSDYERTMCEAGW